jgi:hypothetical protein
MANLEDLEPEDEQPPHLAALGDAAAIIDDLFRRAAEQGEVSAYEHFVDFVRRFRRFSMYNTMLIQVQRRGATAVGTRRQWLSIGRDIKPDAVPIITLLPFGPVEFNFELGDTDGAPVPGDGSDPFRAFGRLPSIKLDKVLAAAESFGIDIEFTEHYGMGLAGTAAKLPLDDAFQMLIEELGSEGIEDDTAARRKIEPIRRFYWRIRINKNHDGATKFATLAHELGHIYCGHLGRGPGGAWPERRELSQEQRELEAESVSNLVCVRNDLTTRSAEYLRPFVTPENIRNISVFAIIAAANRVEVRGYRPKPKVPLREPLAAVGRIGTY